MCAKGDRSIELVDDGLDPDSLKRSISSSMGYPDKELAEKTDNREHSAL